MSCNYFLALAIAVVCLASCFARPDGSNSTELDNPNAEVAAAVAPIAQHDSPPPTGVPPQKNNQMMENLKQSGMPEPQFFKSLDNTSKAEFFNIKKNATLTKGQMVSAIQNFIQSQSPQVQTQYNEWQTNVTSWKKEMITKIKSNLTGEALALAEKIVSFMEDQSITNPETCKLIMGALRNVSHNVTAEVRQAVMANGIGHGPEGPKGPGSMGSHEAMGPGGMGGPRGDESMGMGGPESMCTAPGSMHDGPMHVMHDGPGGHLSGIQENIDEQQAATPLPV